jgi:hypothetical protein
VNRRLLLRLGKQMWVRTLVAAEFCSPLSGQVEKQVKNWLKTSQANTASEEQLTWEAHIVEYVDFVHKKTHVHGNATKAIPPSLPNDIPLLGPRFTPPSYFHVQKQDKTAPITPQIAYLKPLTVVHPFYFQELSEAGCPYCTSLEITWDRWTSTGACEVHGVTVEEFAIGQQMCYKPCAQAHDKLKHAKAKGILREHCRHTASPQQIVFSGRNGSTGQFPVL